MVNQSKKNDPRFWARWRQAGAVYQSPPPKPEPLTNEQKQKLISEYIQSPAGRQKLAASMAAPLRARRDYVSIGRKLFMPQTMPPGALPIFEREPEDADQSMKSTLRGMLDLLNDIQ
jgi:hypothetical protein